MSNGKNMKIGLIGFGIMGQALAKMAPTKGHTLSAIISRSLPSPNQQQLSSTDIFYDFSSHAALDENLSLAAALKKPLLIGTTGGKIDPKTLDDFAKRNGIALFHASSFSIGAHLFLQLVEKASTLLDKGFDQCLVEEHQKTKKDAPSGMGLLIKQATGKEDLDIHSIRLGGSLPSHSLLFDSPSERITLSHTAKSRDPFAEGALLAGEWLIGKVGFYTMEDFLNDYLA